VGFTLAAEMVMKLTTRPSMGGAADKLRVAFLVLGIIGTLLTLIIPQVSEMWLVIPVFILVLAAEAIGRWQFYAMRLL
jgi:DMSO reductase anchor subunit